MSDSTASSTSSEAGVLNHFLNHWKQYLLSVALLTTILFKYKNPLQFYVRFAVYFVLTMTYSLSIIPFLIFRPNNCKNIEWVSFTLGNLLRIFGLQIEIENEKYLQISQPYILIVNHQSSLDFITMMNPNIWPGGFCTPLAKRELLYTGPFGLAVWLCGITFIDRLHPVKSRSTMDKLAQRINDEKLRVWIYPEGTRNAQLDLLPFKKGAFHLAIQAQVPIVCMVTSSYLNFFSTDERKFESGTRVKSRVLPPFQTKGMTADSVNQLAKLLQSKMQKEFDLLNEEIGLHEKYLCKKNIDGRVDNEETLNTDDFLTLNENDFESLNQLEETDLSLNQCKDDTKKSK